jgi:formylglycine-generating enzyme required for sulfatase activity
MGSTDAEIDAAFEQCEQDFGSAACPPERDWFANESPRHSVALDSFWMDRTEVTNAQYARCVADGTCTPPSESGSATRDSYYGDSQFDDYPVIYLDWEDADTYCQWAGGRLPTEAEWEYAARGPEGRIYPWGNDPPDDTLLNHNYNVGDTTSVGSYGKGESWVGTMDMAGNVWEWVSDWYAEDYYTISPAENPTGPYAGDYRVQRGGAWDYPPLNVRSAYRGWRNPDYRDYQFGFRCVVASSSLPTPAAASTPTATSAPPTDTPGPRTDTPVPASSILPSDASLHDTWTRPADSMEMVYVPGGTFQMGSTDGLAGNEQPVHAVTLDGFWIDQTEVTNSQYARCFADGICFSPSKSGSSTRDSYYGDSQFDDYPVLYVSWYDAATYCGWAGGRLPSEAEWEYAARGPDGHIYPWGNDYPDGGLLNYGEFVGDTAQVGSYPDGASWVGAMDMAGNVWEWVNDWYGEYSSEVQTNPKGPETGEERVLRGGSWYGIREWLRAASRGSVPPVVRTDYYGFRCVVEPSN